MLSMKPVNYGEGFLVSGYPNGSDWLIYAGEPYTRPEKHDYGIAGDRWVWLTDTNKMSKNKRLRIWDAVEQRPHVTIDFSQGAAMAAASRDGRLLYVLFSANHSAKLATVDLASGQIAREAAGLPDHWLGPITVRPDGKLIYQHHEESQDKRRLDGVTLVDPDTGAFEVDLQTTGLDDMAGRCFQECLFRTPSPDGRYWLRPDVNHLPVMKPEGANKPLYGVTVQLWEAFPLKFVRRIVVGWVEADDRAQSYHALAEAAAAANLGPLGNIHRSAFPAEISNSKDDWFAFEFYVRQSLAAKTAFVDWQPDGQAFWVRSSSSVSCVGVDGSISPLLRSERARIHGNHHEWPMDLTVMPGRRARVTYQLMSRKPPVGIYTGTIEYDGMPSPTPWAAYFLPMAQDGFNSDDQAAEAKVAARLAKVRNEGRMLTVPLDDMTEAGCIAAIDALTEQITAGFAQRAIADEIRISFKSKAKTYAEDKFFAEVAAKYPAAAPALRRLIEKFAADEKNIDIYWSSDRGIGVLAYAVMALGLIDADAFPTIQRYAARIDGEHESFFIQKTVPALFKAHGWTDAAIDFGVYLLIYDGSPWFYDFSTIWKKWGMGKAVMATLTPQQFAARLARQFHSEPDAIQHLAEGFENKFPQPHAPWVRDVFKELADLVPNWPK